MKKLAGLLFLSVLLGACATSGSSAKQVHYVVLQTDPAGATISFGGGQSCESPCRIGVIDQVAIRIGRTGYKAHTATLTRQTKSPMKISLEPVIVDTELETMELPDLQ